jgi:hypothetical protein
VERVVRNQKKEGVDLVEGKAEEQLGGVKFSIGLRSDDWSHFSVRLNVTAKPLLPGSPAINASSIGSLIAFHKLTREDLFLRSPLSLSPIWGA